MDLETNMIPAGVTMQAQALPRNTYNLSPAQQMNGLNGVLPSAPPPSVIYRVMPPMNPNKVYPVSVPRAQPYQAPPPPITTSSSSASACKPWVIALSVVLVLSVIAGIVIAIVVTRNNDSNNSSSSFCDYTCHNSPFTPCISSSNVCDGDWDCLQGEDENGCSDTTCNGFVCPSSSLTTNNCIPLHWRCDGIVDCSGGEDEEDCDSVPGPGTCFGYTCPFGVYSQYEYYGSSNCIHQSSVCDGTVHCIGGFDEQDCVTIGPITITYCSWNSVLCDGACVPSYQVCDGFDHCSDGLDENNCNIECSSDEFRCESGTHSWYAGYCIPLGWQCDNFDDCSDAEDEKDCPVTCPTTQFACVNGGPNCIPTSWVCDEDDDCEGGTDEANCACDADKFKCEAGATGGGNCISIEKKCDGTIDCSDGADENECVLTSVCKDATTSQPISLPKTKFCDNTENCLGGIDEDNCLIAPDGPEGGNVQIRCVNTGQYSKFCSANWEQSTGDAACEALGYSTMSEFAIAASATAVQGILVNTDGTFNLEELTHKDPVDCPDNSVIEFKCTRDTTCGLVSKSITRIVGGEDTTIATHPWQASLQQGVFGSVWIHFCGAIIISEEWAMTSAHCVNLITSEHYTSFRVAAGITKLSDTVTDTNAYAIKSIVHHPLYDHHTAVFDIALIKVDSAFVRSSTIQPVCLPASGEIFTEGANATITGWGATTESGSTTDVLQVATVPLLNTESCRNTYSTLAPYVKDDMICAGYPAGEKDTCQGDSGGPLIATRNSQQYVAGITSWGIGCARPNKPGVYTEVSDILDWARREIEKAEE